MDWKEQLAGLKGLVPEAPQQSTEPAPEPKAKKLPRLRVELDKRRKGKLATLITGHPGTDEEIDDLARLLKTKLAVGGSTRDGEILLQGDILQRTKDLLTQLGYRV